MLLREVYYCFFFFTTACCRDHVSCLSCGFFFFIRLKYLTDQDRSNSFVCRGKGRPSSGTAFKLRSLISTVGGPRSVHFYIVAAETKSHL